MPIQCGVIRYCLVLWMYNLINFSNLICVLLEDISTNYYKNRSVSRVRAAFFSERVVNVWNSLPDSVDFSTLSKFKRSIMRIDYSKFLTCFSDLFVFTVVLLSQYSRRNDKATVSARMSLVCLAHRLYHCAVSSDLT